MNDESRYIIVRRGETTELFEPILQGDFSSLRDEPPAEPVERPKGWRMFWRKPSK